MAAHNEYYVEFMANTIQHLYSLSMAREMQKGHVCTYHTLYNKVFTKLLITYKSQKWLYQLAVRPFKYHWEVGM